jgi:DNA-binding IclR family transcriptional regulator
MPTSLRVDPPSPMARPPPGRRQKVQSVEIGMGVLKALAAVGAAAPLSIIASTAAMPPAKAHRYLQSLVAAGFAEPDGAGRYRLGSEALRIGLAALGALDIAALAGGHLARLSAELGECCFLAVPGNSGATVVRVEQPTRSVTVAVRLGAVLPDERSATGLCFAAFSTARGRRIGRLELLADIRAAGSASVEGTLLQGVNAVSAPVFDHAGRLAGGLTTLAPASSMDVRPDGRAAMAVRAAAAALSDELGCPGCSVRRPLEIA